MEKKYYALKLIPSRPDFAMTMTDDERATMGAHLAYWTEFMNQGKVVVFGPVMDPSGVYGFGVLVVDSEEEVKSFIAGDPAGKINKYEYYLMMAVVPAAK